jgi:hypothetical protein
MPTKSFQLAVAPDAQGRTTVTLTAPDGTQRAPVVLGLQGERTLYGLMSYVRAGETAPIDLLETWDRNLKPDNDQRAPLSEADIEEAIRKCGI